MLLRPSLRVTAATRTHFKQKHSKITPPLASAYSSASKDSQVPKNSEKSKTEPNEPSPKSTTKSPEQNKAKSVAQADAELRERLEKMSGEGGAAGIEYEDGKPNAMKRGVRNNIFRLI
ncbi:hypothetical protein N7532_005210 [Penicillium argentinense]|uniref:Uncharacterized protein n=1 Tax=Penicillium argentinense TaxID=1131581 RepID=A0A9W9FDQ0_9EURO|nr:uncharacterized protein N7532_005210 [Penicillium argentinense]KAJ5098209.1 hypothetical protein N7532_005210 [Penicillium argentinense]